MKKFLLLILFFYILVLLQTSFLIHFNILGWWGWSPNLILISVILISFLEKPENNFGFFSAFAGGFFLDIFSESFFGFNILILTATVLFIKFIFKKYVRIPLIERA